MAKKGGKSKSKRSNQKILNAFEIAERQANGSNSDNESGDDSDNFQDGIMDARKFLNKDGGKFIDEEIDSDDALGSDDDYDVLNSKFSQTIRDKQKKLKDKSKKNHKGAQISSDEEDDDEAYDSIDEGQLVSLSQAWDMDDDDLKKFEAQGKGKKNQDIVLDDKWETESSEDDDDDEDDSENSQESDEGSSDEDESEESEEEDIFNASGDDDDDEIDLANTVSHLKSTLKKPPKEKRKLVTESIEENEFNIPTTNKLSINDMISAVDNNISKDAILIEDEAKALNAPLPKNIQQRHERKAAYELTKEEVSKWEDVVQQNRQAEVLKFPLNPTVKHNDTATTFRSDNVPINDMEKQIHKVLEDSSLVDDKKEATFEELAMAKLSPDELKKRTNELRLMRELMFRDEARAKRIKKIKSKTFRKIKKKERLREQELVEGDEIDSDNEDHERKRAEERMNLKHKTNSKWAKSMIKSGLSKDASNRSELEEMLRQGEKLRSKQLGYENGEQSDEDISDIEKEYENDTDDHELKTKLGKGVLAMDFMKNAEERKKQENLQELETLKKLENGEDLDLEDANSVNVIKNQGRRIYTPSASSIKDGINEMNEEIRQEIEDDESRNLVNQLSKKSQMKVVEPSPEVAKDSKQEVSNEESGSSSVNPWLSTEEVKKSSKAKIIDQTSSRESKSAAKIKKKSKTSQLPEELIDMEKTLDIDIHDDDNDEEFKQQDLIKEAFAGDNVVSEFKKEKRKIIKEEDDQEEDLTLPGWGDWAGGSKKSKKRKIIRTINGVAQKDKRKDKNLKNVIINERVNKKNLKYQSSEVPYGFESKEQYERSLRMPVGQEWTSRETHQKLTMPRIITKQGTVIDPLKAPFK